MIAKGKLQNVLIFLNYSIWLGPDCRLYLNHCKSYKISILVKKKA